MRTVNRRSLFPLRVDVSTKGESSTARLSASHDATALIRVSKALINLLFAERLEEMQKKDHYTPDSSGIDGF